jgi:hypothetical protein
MATGLDPAKIIEFIGHTGEEKVWPDLPEPNCYRGFHLAELQLALLNFGFIPVFLPRAMFSQSVSTTAYYGHIDLERLEMNCVLFAGNHAVAYNGISVYDPAGILKAFHPSLFDYCLLIFKSNEPFKLDIEKKIKSFQTTYFLA